MSVKSLSVQIVTPAPTGSTKGNRVTAERWETLLGELGHKVRIVEALDARQYDVLVALHARKSHPAIVQSIRQHPQRPVLVVLTGTDLYHDIHVDTNAQQSLELASRLIVLQRLGLDELPAEVRAKTRVIYQSVRPPEHPPPRRNEVFEVCVIGHLRDVKDPMRTAEATKLLPPSSRIHVLQLGFAYTKEYEARAKAETENNPRYEWLGELPRDETLLTLARCRLLVLSSRSEGGANTVSEALACGVPILSSNITGSTGILGKDYPGLFPVSDTQALASLLQRAETESEFYESLQTRCEQLKSIVDPDRERQSWKALLKEVV